MTARVTIEAASKAEAELLVPHLPVRASAASWRGYGVIRLGPLGPHERRAVIEAVSRAFGELGLQWARIRHGDEEHVLRAGLRTG